MSFGIGLAIGMLVVIFYYEKTTFICRLAYRYLTKCGYVVLDHSHLNPNIKTPEYGYISDEKDFEETLKRHLYHNQK